MYTYDQLLSSHVVLHSDGIAVRIKQALPAIPASSMHCVVTIDAEQFKVLPVARNVWVIDVLRRQQNFMMHNKSVWF